MGKFRGIDLEDGWIRRELAAIRTQLREMNSAKRLVIASDSKQGDIASMNHTAGFSLYLLTTIIVPEGFTQAIVQMYVSAGVSFGADATGGNVGVQAVAGNVSGPALSNGRPAAGGGGAGLSASAGLATKIAATSFTPFNIGVLAFANGAGLVNNSGNVHLSASILFTRG